MQVIQPKRETKSSAPFRRGVQQYAQARRRTSLAFAHHRDHYAGAPLCAPTDQQVPRVRIAKSARVSRQLVAFLLIVLCLIGWSLFIPASASAHAEYDHSNPAANAIVATAPTEVDIWFTERLEPSGSSAQLFDKNGQQVLAQSRMGTDPKQMIVDLPKGVGNGTYSVVWSTLSADDGHPAQ